MCEGEREGGRGGRGGYYEEGCFKQGEVNDGRDSLFFSFSCHFDNLLAKTLKATRSEREKKRERAVVRARHFVGSHLSDGFLAIFLHMLVLLVSSSSSASFHFHRSQ